jgi:hypothetical protein
LKEIHANSALMSINKWNSTSLEMCMARASILVTMVKNCWERVIPGGLGIGVRAVVPATGFGGVELGVTVGSWHWVLTPVSIGCREGALQYGIQLLGLRKWSSVTGEVPCKCRSEVGIMRGGKIGGKWSFLYKATDLSLRWVVHR